MKATCTLLAATALSLALLPITHAEKAKPAAGLAALVGSDLVDAEGNAVSIDKLEGKVILKADPKKSVPVEKLPIAILGRVAITFSITTNYASNPVLLTVLPAEEPAEK